jgi:phosphatidylethanolamine/phosphatidyl-N-methylethanolamine N-methyltransferase
MEGTMPPIDRHATATARARYDRNARFYDFMEWGNERHAAHWRAALWARVVGPRVLEVGVGTGKNMPFYPPDMAITAIDLSPRMLDRARENARRAGLGVDLREADAQALPFPDASFDTAIGTFVFCSVPDPMLGLRELRRVLVPGGQLLLVEHVLSTRPRLRRLMRALNPFVVRLMGANIDRETVENVRHAGFIDIYDENKRLDIVKVIAGRTTGATPRAVGARPEGCHAARR